MGKLSVSDNILHFVTYFVLHLQQIELSALNTWIIS